MDIKIVTYRESDYETLVDLWERAGLPYKPKGRDRREKIAAEMKRGVGRFLFAVDGEKYIGTVLVTHDGRKGWINRVAVLPEYRHKGIARKLVEAAEQWLDEQGIEIYACQIEAYNEDSYEVFKKLGYIPFEGIRYLTKRKYPEV